MGRAWRRHGFTLVELLVVITIIGILIALLLPAVQAAREAARRTECNNHLKQLALGCLNHESTTGRLPTNGWGWAWQGDADRGNDWRQPAGWLYNILPFIEQQPLHDLGAGMQPWNSTAKKSANAQRMATPLSTLYCPSRRPAIAYPWTDWDPANATGKATWPIAGRSDYAGNGGDFYNTPDYPKGAVWASIYTEGGPNDVIQVENPAGQMTAAARTTFANVASVATGIMFCGSLIKMADIADGASNTYLIGEKYLNPDAYLNGSDGSDNGPAFQGDNADIVRWSSWTPMQDTPGVGSYGFGSAHASGFNMAFCDGSSRFMSYTIDVEANRRLCNRKDGLPVDPKTF